jgi:transposase
VHSAAIQDRDGGSQLLEAGLKRFAKLKKVWADGGYAGKLASRISELEIVKRNELHKFVVLPKRWIVERTFAWLGNSRRLSKDYEVKTSHSESIIYISMTKRMLQRIA